MVAGSGEGPEDFIDDDVSGYLVPVRATRRPRGYHRRRCWTTRRASAVGEAGRAAALELSWERNAKLTLAVYEKVLAAAP